MGPQKKVDIEAEDWFNENLDKLRYGQDYTICSGHSKRSENKIQISRPYIRLFSTGITKIYQSSVLNDNLPKVEYTDDELKQMDKDFDKTELNHARSKGEGWE